MDTVVKCYECGETEMEMVYLPEIDEYLCIECNNVRWETE